MIQKLPSYVGSLALAWSPDSSFLANGGGGPGESTAVRIWDVATGQMQFEYGTGGTSNFFRVAWDATGRYIALVNEDAYVDILDVETQSLLNNTREPWSALTIDWSPDNAKIVTADNAGGVIIWDVSTTEQLVYLDMAHNGEVREFEWNFDGSKLATVSSIDRTLIIWDTTTLPSAEGIPTVTPWPIYPTATP